MSQDEHTWTAAERPFAPMATMGDEDLSNFLDLDDMDFGFPAMDGEHFDANHNNAQAMHNGQAQRQYPYEQHGAQGAHNFAKLQETLRGALPLGDGYQDGAGAFHWNGQFHPQVPPTPTSAEMHPGQYQQQIDHARQFSNGSYAHKDTFLHNPGTSVRDYAVREGPLSPLSSPAIFPHQESTGPSSIQSLTAPSSVTASPKDFDETEESTDERPRKTRRRDTPKTKAASKKRPASGSVKAGEQPAAKEAQTPGSGGMRPPPKPASAKSTPSFGPQRTNSVGPPATPASLMHLSKQSSAQVSPMGLASPTTEALGFGMEELTLPEAAAPPVATSGSATPRALPPLSARATPALLPRLPSSASSITSPSPVPFGNTSKNPSGRGGNRKRNSTSSTLVSPALRPRISPNIKPLGGGAMNVDETHALLLASKSNYQNLLEGNHLPGVTYPSELSTNLTSKRTSHKIAEQGRRNRINTALQEMQTLLPGSPSIAALSPESEDLKSKSDKAKAASAQAANSKAATVEHAIDYIRTLSGQLQDKDAENERLKAEMEALRRRLSDAGVPYEADAT